MREVNFSIPNVNKASVGITTALYDRRALDCTSTLPLINSLNHLAYLTTSSARIRDILTVDGGIERLVCILKQGRSKDMMGMWKWNLAFQCVVNIGVRGTENVRTRVVEADMVPVIATILDNYNKVVEKCREKADEAKRQAIQAHAEYQQGPFHSPHHHHALAHASASRASPSFTNRHSHPETDQRISRRQAPPASIDVSASIAAGPSTGTEAIATPGRQQYPAESSSSSTPPPPPSPAAVLQPLPSSSTPSPERPGHPAHRNSSGSVFRSPDGHLTPTPIRPLAQLHSAGAAVSSSPAELSDAQPRRTGVPHSFAHPTLASQPASPTTPLPPAQMRSPTIRPASMLAPASRSRRRPSIRHQNSTLESDDPNGDSMQSDESPDAEVGENSDVAGSVGIQDITMGEGEDSILAEAALGLAATPMVSETQDTGTFNITHRGPMDGSITTTNQNHPGPAMGLSPTRQAAAPPRPAVPVGTIPRILLERPTAPAPAVIAAIPRDEDVLMSLQLLAYISKYCCLRPYFQRCHLVPKLKIGKELRLLDGDFAASREPDDEKNAEEFLLPNDFNIFPLVEKFTVRHHTPDMQYWAGVVMRNLCRKDDERGGIRQCAYYQCGKWEEFTRQFAKCRRCRRTKYCSKECQKSAWAFHRHWCVSASH